jgi:oxygen-independent coproporphyrinogen-3 oxidase
MCDLSLDLAAMSTKLGVNIEGHFANELASLTELEAHGLVRRVPGGLEVTNIGRLFIRNIAMRFAQHPRAGGGTQTVKDDLMGYFNRTCN